MKECMSEHDHYKAFPKKDYPLDEECDLIEIDGKEIAYCLCRHNNFCNQKPIADQFINFEEVFSKIFLRLFFFELKMKLNIYLSLLKKKRMKKI